MAEATEIYRSSRPELSRFLGAFGVVSEKIYGSAGIQSPENMKLSKLQVKGA